MNFSVAINLQPFMGKRLMMSFLLAIILFSCSNQPNVNTSALEENFSKLVPLTDMNESLQLAVDTDRPAFQPGEIGLVIHNQSPYFLSFDSETHIRLLGSRDRMHWEEVNNALTYSGEMQLSPKGTILLDIDYTVVKPILDQSNSDILLRVVLVGEIMKDDTPTGEEVGAFVDVVLQP
jgi:hypothetical protein